MGVPELGGSWQRDADYFLVVWKENNLIVEGELSIDYFPVVWKENNLVVEGE